MLPDLPPEVQEFLSLLWKQMSSPSSVSIVTYGIWTGVGYVGARLTAAFLNKKNLLMTQNFAAISQLTQSSSQAAAYSKVLRFIADSEKQVIPVEEIQKDHELEQQALVILAAYQFLAVAVEKRFIDRELVRTQFLPSMRSKVTKLKLLINHYRERMERDYIWYELEEFVKRNGRSGWLRPWILRIIRWDPEFPPEAWRGVVKPTKRKRRWMFWRHRRSDHKQEPITATD